MNLFDLQAKISLDSKGYEDGIKNAREGMKNLGKYTVNLTNKVSSIGKTAFKAFGGLVTAGTGAMVALGKIGKDYNSKIETYVTNFTTMLGDAEKAVAKVEEIRVMAAKTPFGMAELADATQTLLAFGIEENKTTGIMQQLGDIALGNKERFSSLTLAFSQATSAGKLAGQDLLQMINAGFNPLQQLTKETGLSVGQLKEVMGGLSNESAEAMLQTAGLTEYGEKIIRQGQISADDLAYALDVATKKGGQFYKGMESASKTTEGLMSTLKDDATAFLGELTKGFSESLKTDVLPNAIDTIAKMSEAFKTQGIDGVIDVISKSFTNLVITFTKKAPKAIKIAKNTLKKIIKAFKDNKSQLKKAAEMLFGELMNAFSETVDEILPLVEEFVPTVIEMFIRYKKEMFLAGGKLLMAIVEGVADNIDELADAAFNAVNSFANFVKKNLAPLADAAKKIISGLGSALIKNAPELFGSAADIVNELIDLIANPENFKNMDKAAWALYDSLVGAFKKIFTVKNIAKLTDFAVAIIDQLTDIISDEKAMDKIWQDIADFLDVAIESAITQLPRIAESLGKLGLAILKTMIIQPFEEMSDTFSDIIDNMVSGLEDGFGFTDFIKGGFKGFGSSEPEKTSNVPFNVNDFKNRPFTGDTINITVNPSQGMDEEELAKKVSREIAFEKQQRMRSRGGVLNW